MKLRRLVPATSRFNILPWLLIGAMVSAFVDVNGASEFGSVTPQVEASVGRGEDAAGGHVARELSSPSVVTIEGDNYSYSYQVNGIPETIRGVGYNAIYRHLSDEERAARYDRDFALMRQAGINTISGWGQDKGYEQDRFDELLLTKAEQYGIGVIMPYYLPPDADYTDSEFRQRVAEDAANMVRHFKDYPAVRMWGLGNEVFPEITSAEQAQAFASFLIELADLVHSIDPNHPVIYRETEDVYVPELSRALRADDVRRTWLIYGMNVYTYRIYQILSEWPQQGFDQPIIISEFAPPDLELSERPGGYVQMWRALRSYPSLVMGGLAYVWTTEGPEPVDRYYGLVDDNGVAIDDSYNRLAAEYLREIARGVPRRLVLADSP